MNLPKISIVLPIHNMDNAEFFLRRVLTSIVDQSFKDIEVIITDNSPDNRLEEITKEFDLNIQYYLNKPNQKNGMASNTNEALKHSTGEFIKILYLDDYLAHKDALKVIVEAFIGVKWLVTGCDHDNGTFIGSPHLPQFHPYDKDNFIGSPSVLTIQNGLDIYFDETMTWLLDLDFFKRCHARYGMPRFVDDINVTIGIGSHQMTNILTQEAKEKEVEYLKKKHA